MRRMIAILLLLAAAATAPAAGWLGKRGHPAITYDVATSPTYRLPPEVAKLMAMASAQPDYYEFSNPAAHAQMANPQIENGRLVTDQKGYEALRREWQARSEAWHAHYFNSAVMAMKSGDRTRAAALLGYALHNRQDFGTHGGMPNVVHAWLSDKKQDPDENPRRLGRARDYTETEIARFRREVGEDNWRLFRGEAVRTPGKVVAEIPRPLDTAGLELDNWNPRNDFLPKMQDPTVKARVVNAFGGVLGADVDHGNFAKVHEAVVGYHARQEKMVQLLQTNPPPSLTSGENPIVVVPRAKSDPELFQLGKEAMQFAKNDAAKLESLPPQDKRALSQWQVAAEREWTREFRQEHDKLKLHRAKWKRENEKAAPPKPPPGGSASRARFGKLPKSPGGVALNPDLQMPAGLRNVTAVTLDSEGIQIALETATGKILVDWLDPQTFATVLRCIAAGQVPFITIGTEPSDRLGYAKVTYAQPLIGTKVGEILFHADIQFKAIFVDYPLGEFFDRNTPDDELLRGYPGRGGESARFWITCSGMSLKWDKDRLVIDRPGMRILCETTLEGEIVDDPTLERYVERLSQNWTELADTIPEFREVQDVALATALAFWIRENHIPVREELWQIPDAIGDSPEYSRLVCNTQLGVITGGVCLTPEEKSRAPGHLLLFLAAQVMDESEQEGVAPAVVRGIFAVVAAIFIGLITLLPATALWILGKIALRRSGDRLPFGRLTRTWLAAIVTQAALMALVSTLTNSGRLPRFDREFLTLIAGSIAAPFVLFFWLRRAGEKLGGLDRHLQKRVITRLFVIHVSLSLPICAGVLSLSLAMLTIAATGPLPNPALARLLSVELMPANVYGALTPRATPITPSPDPEDGRLAAGGTPSLKQLSRRPFQHEHFGAASTEETIHIQTGDPQMPASTMHRIRWPADMRIQMNDRHYSTDGDTADAPVPPPHPDERQPLRSRSHGIKSLR